MSTSLDVASRMATVLVDSPATERAVVIVGVVAGVAIIASVLIASRDIWLPIASSRRSLIGPAILGAIALVVLGLLIAHLDDLKELLVRIEQGNRWWIAAAIGLEAFSFVGYMAMTRSVHQPAAPRLTNIAAVELTLAGVVATRVLSAGGAGGIAFTGWVLGRAGMGARDAANRLAAFLVLLYSVYMATLLLGGLLVIGGLAGDVPRPLGIVAALVGGLSIAVSIAISYIPRDLRDRAEGLAQRPGANKLMVRLATVPEVAGNAMRLAAKIARNDPSVLWGAFVWWIFDIAVLWATFHAFGSPPPVGTLVLCYFLGMLGNLLPLPGGVGGTEGGMLGALAACGVDAGLAVVAVVSYQVISTYLPVLPGLGAYWSLRRRMRHWAEDADAEDLARDEAEALPEGPGAAAAEATTSDRPPLVAVGAGGSSVDAMSTTDPDTEKTGAEGDASADTSTPFTPRKDDDTPLGDTDQHSKADHGKDPADEIKRASAGTGTD